MPEISKREKQLEWVCRILLTVDVLVVISGYIAYFQAKYQLTSPLIPKATIAQILYDTNDSTLKASLVAGIMLIPGLLCYSFKKKVAAIILFSLAFICFILLRF